MTSWLHQVNYDLSVSGTICQCDGGREKVSTWLALIAAHASGHCLAPVRDNESDERPEMSKTN